MKNLSLYIHIPFCIQKCYYCDFLSAPGSVQIQEQYFHALLDEIEKVASVYKLYQIRSIFIGGGTPSIFPPEWIGQIMNAIRKYFHVLAQAEVTIEMNPGTVKDLISFQMLKESGINRISIGLQSTQNEELKAIGRIHTFEEFTYAYEFARQAGFDNINIDLMAALPGQGIDSYKESLNKVCRLLPEHISAYSLIVEEGTPFYNRIVTQKEDLKLPTEDIEREMYQLTKEILANFGYIRYEISNYARAGRECHHNLVYWTRGDYLGLGIGAASMIENQRFKNTTSLEEYLLEKGNVVYQEIENLSKEEQMAEYMILGFRLTKGISKNDFTALYGNTPEFFYQDILSKNQEQGLLIFDKERIYLTDRGMDLSNYVMAQFL